MFGSDTVVSLRHAAVDDSFSKVTSAVILYYLLKSKLILEKLICTCIAARRRHAAVEKSFSKVRFAVVCYHSFHWNRYTPKIHQIEKLRFFGVSRVPRQIEILVLVVGLRVGFRGHGLRVQKTPFYQFFDSQDQLDDPDVRSQIGLLIQTSDLIIGLSCKRAL